MQRCDFASVMAIIRDDLIEGAFSNQMDFVEKLFTSFLNEVEFYFDQGLVNKWFNGLVKVSPVICQFYAVEEDGADKLADDIDEQILPCLSDQAMTVQRVSDLVTRDPSISEGKKQELLASRESGDSYFLACVIAFGMGRKFEVQDIRKPPKNQNSAKSPLVWDYIYDAAAPKPCRNFCGREAELDLLHSTLKENDKVFLQGIAGIGKSEIAKAYAKEHKKEYTNILYFIYSGSLKRDIADLQFSDDKESDDEDARFKRHHRFLRTLAADTLLIIDNFNTTAAEDELFSVIMKYRCKILFTTKSVFADQTCVTVEEIGNHDVLYDLFSRYYKDADDHRETVAAIMETVHYHTLSVELAARLAQSGILTPEQILSKLREEKAAFSGADEIRISKDGQTVKATYYQHIYTLFSLFRLDQRQGYAMQCMSMMPLSGIEARLFAKWVGFKDMNTINELEERGFIRGDDSREFSLHPMMQEVTIADLVPGVESCFTMLLNIGNFCNQYGRDVPHRRLIKQIVENTIHTMKKDAPDFYVRFLEQTYISLFDPSRPKDSYIIIEELDRLLKDEAVGTAEDRAHLIEYHADMEKSAEKKIPKLTQAIEAYPAPTPENVVDLYQLHAKIAHFYRLKKRYEQAQQHLKTAADLSNRFPGHERDNLNLVVGLAGLLNDTKHPKEALEVLAPLEEKLRHVMPNTYEHAMVLRKLAGITANCGDLDKGLALLDESWSIYEFLCGDDHEKLRHYAIFDEQIRSGIEYMRRHPDRRIAGF